MILHSARAAGTTILSSHDLCCAAADAARNAGFLAIIDNTCDEGTYEAAAKYLVDRLTQERQHAERVCVISAGEVSVRLPQTSGRGGRNQHFALECARLFAARSIEAAVVSAGSDGIDGNSDAAGGVADHTTFARAGSLGLNAAAGASRLPTATPSFRRLETTLSRVQPATICVTCAILLSEASGSQP